jgi:hypothetical protein
MTTHNTDYVRVVKCPTCGQDKWKYQGNDLDHEPPCAICRKRECAHTDGYGADQ